MLIHAQSPSYDPRLILSQPRQPPSLHLREGSRATQKCDDTHHQQHGECLEQVPACVVHEEDSFDAEDRAVEEGVWDWGVGEGFREVVEVTAEVDPLGELLLYRLQV